LRRLACRYREYAERAANPSIWEERLRTAEDLEAEARRIEGPVSHEFSQYDNGKFSAALRSS
jgi:hypothetical protein